MPDKIIEIGDRKLTVKQIVDLLWRYKHALEGLTPSGSEFVNDPEYCAEWIRKSRASQHDTIVRQQLKIKESSSTQGRK